MGGKNILTLAHCGLHHWIWLKKCRHTFQSFKNSLITNLSWITLKSKVGLETFEDWKVARPQTLLWFYSVCKSLVVGLGMSSETFWCVLHEKFLQFHENSLDFSKISYLSWFINGFVDERFGWRRSRWPQSGRPIKPRSGGHIFWFILQSFGCNVHFWRTRGCGTTSSRISGG